MAREPVLTRQSHDAMWLNNGARYITGGVIYSKEISEHLEKVECISFRKCFCLVLL